MVCLRTPSRGDARFGSIVRKIQVFKSIWGEVNMETIVTNHAVRRYRERLFNYSSTDKEISGILERIARLGKLVRQRPGNLSNCFEISHRGISIVVVVDSKQTCIITCLGEESYRKWVKAKNRPAKISKRIFYEYSRLCI